LKTKNGRWSIFNITILVAKSGNDISLFRLDIMNASAEPAPGDLFDQGYSKSEGNCQAKYYCIAGLGGCGLATFCISGVC
jgi:hypothetical protein